MRTLLFAPSVRLDADVGGDDDAPKWIQIAYEGQWSGHHQGAFQFTTKHFDALVRNFHANPTYKAGPDGVGIKDTIPFDFNHASEMPASSGTIAVLGTPAQAWVRELEVRQGEHGAELWSLTRFLEPAKSYVRAGKLQWVSVSVWFDAVDPVSGKAIGPMLTSVAFTNQPFLKGMVPLAASAQMLLGAREVLGSLRELFRLPADADVAAVLQELGKLRSVGWAPEKVDAVRAALNLPALSSSDEIFTDAQRLLDRLSEQEAADQALAAGTATTLTTETQETSAMPLDLKTLAVRAGLAPTADEDALVKRLDEGAQAIAHRSTLFGALGVESLDKASSRLASLVKAESDLATLEPVHKKLLDEQTKAAAALVDADVEEAMKVHGLQASARAAIKLLRETNPTQFATDFPKPAAEHQQLTSVISGPPALRTTPTALDRAAVGADGKVRLQALPGGKTVQSGPVNLDACAGRNRTEKAMSYLQAQPGGDKLNFEELHEQACLLLRGLSA